VDCFGLDWIQFNSIQWLVGLWIYIDNCIGAYHYPSPLSLSPRFDESYILLEVLSAVRFAPVTHIQAPEISGELNDELYMFDY
jgi:hypothetical protein